MNLNTPEGWRLIWVIAVVGFAVAELVTPAAFFFLPFAAGGVVAAVSAFLDVPVVAQWLVFVLVSAVVFAVLWPIGRRLERGRVHHTTGARRWVGREAFVLAEIPGGTGRTGMVRLDREEWRAESGTGAAIPAGSTVLVSRVDGTRLVVLPLDLPAPSEGAF
jgi:membrane protein implicated in regulation of membrane protease activity